MNDEKNVIDIICQTHSQVSERVILLKDMMTKFAKEDIFDNLKEVLTFFSKHIPIHFAYEEIMIDELKTTNLKQNEHNMIDEILNEHKKLIKVFGKMSGLIEGIEKVNSNLKEDFIELVNDLLEMLPKHAKKEDRLLFPVAQRKLNNKQKEEIELKISKIHL